MVSVLQRARRFIARRILRRSALHMWQGRARQYGARAVLHISHTTDEMEAVTRMQKSLILPLLAQQLRGDEKSILDVGCGPGRFTPDLAEIIHGKAIGVDPIQDFLDMAPRNANVEYRRMKPGVLPVGTGSVDVVWICLVLGGLTEERVLRSTVVEVQRVLAPSGLLLLVENTSEKQDGDYWKFKPVSHYQTLFDFAELRHLSDYYDLGERISILAGRQCR